MHIHNMLRYTMDPFVRTGRCSLSPFLNFRRRPLIPYTDLVSITARLSLDWHAADWQEGGRRVLLIFSVAKPCVFGTVGFEPRGRSYVSVLM